MWQHLQLNSKLALVRYTHIEHHTTMNLALPLLRCRQSRVRVGVAKPCSIRLQACGWLAVILPLVCVITFLHGTITLIIHLKKLQSSGLFPLDQLSLPQTEIRTAKRLRASGATALATLDHITSLQTSDNVSQLRGIHLLIATAPTRPTRLDPPIHHHA